MNTILLFFVLPISIILLSIVLQKVLKCPTLVAITFFAILFIVTYIVDSGLLIFAIAYTVLSYITAVITRLICSIKSRIGSITNDCSNNERRDYICTNNCSRTGNELNVKIRSGNNENECNPTRFLVTTNQESPVLSLSNQNCNQTRRNCCCLKRR